MKRQLKLGVLMFVSSTLLTGCFGYDRILFVTKTNVGLDVENKPPTAELTIARRELGIAPAFRDAQGKEKTLPLLASFGRKGSLFGTGITSQFAGGDAAVSLGRGVKSNRKESKPDEEITPGLAISTTSASTVVNKEPSTEQKLSANDIEESNDSVICLSEEPDSRPPLKKLWHWLTGGRPEENTRAFYFATDTSFGLKVGWDGTGGPYPTNLKLGYNRKESAFPPVMIKEGCDPEKFEDKRKSTLDENGNRVLADDQGNPIKLEDGKHIPFEPWYEVQVPSFFASLDNTSTLTTLEESNVEHVQFFATGKAATGFVNRPKVNDEAFQKMAPNAAGAEASQLELNQDLIEEIEEVFDRADGNKKSEIMASAKSLALIEIIDMDENGPKSEHFIEELKEHSDSSDPHVSNNLNKLRHEALAQP